VASTFASDPYLAGSARSNAPSRSKWAASGQAMNLKPGTARCIASARRTAARFPESVRGGTPGCSGGR